MEKIIFINGLKTDYSVNEKGEVFSNKFGKRNRIKFNTIKGGYKMCYIYLKGKRYDMLVHRVVALTFIENTQNKNQINYKDGNKENNCVDNLEWVSQSENIKHAYDNKLMTKTHKDCYNALLDEEKVKLIRIELNKKTKQRDIANIFGVSEQVISNIKLGRSYFGIGLIEKNLAIDINTL